jgi:hypothetical protein
VAVAAIALLSAVHFEVGADGVLIRERMKRRFVPWSDVTDVQPSARGVALTIHRAACRSSASICHSPRARTFVTSANTRGGAHCSRASSTR